MYQRSKPNHHDAASFNDVIYGVSGSMRDSACNLQSLAASFQDVGNSVVADRLWAIAKDLEVDRQILMDAWGNKVHDDLRASERATANMLLGVFAGVTIGADGGLDQDTAKTFVGLAEMVSPGSSAGIKPIEDA
ncbi:hypothetical protein CcrBL47_gp336 [Caulobacter phage BL47]|nr:hypothetical protein CcrBL47_gp336 [Caulobacter phage BL47]